MTAAEEARKLLDECTDTSYQWKGQSMPESVSREFARKVKRAQALVDGLKTGGQMRNHYDIPPENIHLPASPRDRGDVAGYISLGDAVIRSEAFTDYVTDKPRVPMFKV